MQKQNILNLLRHNGRRVTKVWPQTKLALPEARGLENPGNEVDQNLSGDDFANS